MGNLISFVRRYAAAVFVLAIAGCATFRGERTESVAADPAPVTAPVEAPAEGTPEPEAEPSDDELLSLRADAPLRYVVKKGDTLWDIASFYLKDPWQWPELWYANPQVANPHLIYPGDVLQLIWQDGRPVLARTADVERLQEPPQDLGIERLSPTSRELPIEGAIPAIPIDVIRNFLRGPRVVSKEELALAPYIVDFTDEHMMGASGNLVYVKNLPAATDYTYSVIRLGDAYRDPDTDDVIGYEGVPVAEADLREAGPIALMRLSNSMRESLVGDRLLPAEAEYFQAFFYPHAPTRPVGARIIAVFNGVSQIGQYQIVTLNRGSEHGVEPGHVMSILQAGREVRDPYGATSGATVDLPELYAGRLMVFKVSQKISYGLVMSAIRSIHVLDRADLPKPSHGS